MYALIVGGAGYIGSHTTKYLLNQGFSPVILDDLSTGHSAAILRISRKIPFYQGSCEDRTLVENILKKHRIQAIFHFGAKALVEESMREPMLYYQSNVNSSIALIQAALHCKIPFFIFSSTCATYGIPPQHARITEETPQVPINPYGQSKLFVEKILHDAAQFSKGSFRCCILRYFNACGADPDGALGEDHNPETHFIPNLIKAALEKDQKLRIHGKDYPTPDGTCIRDFVHVMDLAHAHYRALRHLQASSHESDAFNLGSENGHSILELIEVASKVLHVEIPHEFGPRRPGDPPILVADASKAKKVLQWSPQYNMELILKTTYQWMSSHPKGFST